MMTAQTHPHRLGETHTHTHTGLTGAVINSGMVVWGTGGHREAGEGTRRKK